VLEDSGKLLYYHSKEGTPPAGVIDLKRAEVTSGPIQKKKALFSIKNSERIFLFSTEDEADRDAWVKVLSSVSSPSDSKPTDAENEKSNANVTLDVSPFRSPSRYSENGFLQSIPKMKVVFSSELECSVAEFFWLFVSQNSDNFHRQYHDKRSDTELEFGQWANFARDVTYRVPVKVPIGPKTTRVIEKQRYNLFLEEANKLEELVFETSSNMLDIPFADTFRVEAKWDINTVSPTRCSCTVSSGVNFVKTNMFKTKIETNTIKEIIESFDTVWKPLAIDAIQQYRMSGSNPSAVKTLAPTLNPTTLPTGTSAAMVTTKPALPPPEESWLTTMNLLYFFIAVCILETCILCYVFFT